MPPVRVAFVVHSLATGGIQRHVCRLASSLNPEKFTPYIISLSGNGPAVSWMERTSVNLVGMNKRDGNNLRVIFQFAQWLRREKIDVIHSHNWGTLLESTIARWLARTPVHIHSERGTFLNTLETRSLQWKRRLLMARCCFRTVNALVTNAHSLAQRLVDLCAIKKDKLYVIPNGVPYPSIDKRVVTKIRHTIASGLPRIVLGSVGRLDVVKSYATAIQSLAILCRQGANVVMVIVGDGPCRSSLVTLAKQLNVQDRLILPGYNPDIENWISAMDVYFNCSISEAMSQSVVEAMALARPLVLTAVGDHGNLGNGNAPSALVVPPGSSEQLAAAFIKMISDTALRSTMANNALSYYHNFHHLPIMVSRYEELYQCQLCSSKIRSRSRCIVPG